MNIVGTMYIYKNQQYGGYSTYVTNQDKEKMYIAVGFKKESEPTEERLKIEVKKSFLTFYKTKQGMAKPKLVVLDYEKENEWLSTDELDDTLPF